MLEQLDIHMEKKNSNLKQVIQKLTQILFYI